MEKQNILSALLPLAAIFLGTAAHGQVGINNNSPQATLDIAATTTAAANTKPDALLVPRMSLTQLIAKNDAYVNGITGTPSPQNGAMVFVNDVSGTPAGKTLNVTATGFYYFDGTVNNNVWKGIGGVVDTSAFWSHEGNTYSPAGTTQIIGLLNASTAKNLSVQGDVVTVNPATTGSVTSFQVNGASTNTGAYNATTPTQIHFERSNLAYTSTNGEQTTYTLFGLKDGGTYTLAMQGTGATQFGSTGFASGDNSALKFYPTNPPGLR